MRLNSKGCTFVISALFLFPAIARPGAIVVNGTCEQGNCTAVDSVAYGANTGTVPFNFTYTAGSDPFQISGNYSASYDSNGTNFNVFLTAMYTGSAPSTSNDSFTVHVLQNFFDNSPGTWDGQYNEEIPLTMSSNVGSGSTVAAQLLFDGQTVGLIGPYGPGSYDVTNTANLSGLTGDTLNSEYQFLFDFAAGTQTGASVVTSSVPEPAQVLPIAGAILALAVVMFRRSKYSAGLAA